MEERSRCRLPGGGWRALWLVVAMVVSGCVAAGGGGGAAGGGGAGGGEVTVWRNASFSASGDAVLLLGSRHRTADPSAPYYSDPGGTDWQLVFQRASPALSPQGEPLVIGDPGQGGGPLFGPLWWRPEEDTATFVLYDTPVVLDLRGGGISPLRLPSAEVAALFDGQVEDERGLPLSLVPSPDGRRVAVFYRLAVLDADNPLLIHHYDAIATFEWTDPPRYEGALALTPWQGSEAPLRLDPPLPVSPLPGLPPDGGPPPVEERRPLLFPAYFLWSDDGTRLYVVDRGDDSVPDNRVAEIVVGTSPTLRMMGPSDLLPGAPVPTRGGGADEEGRVLFAREPFDAPNAGGIELDTVPGWPGFGGRGATTVSALGYGY